MEKRTVFAMENVENREKSGPSVVCRLSFVRTGARLFLGHGEHGEQGDVGAGRMREALSMFYTFSTAKKGGADFDVEIGRAWRRAVGSRVPRDRVGELSMAMENVENMEK